MKVKKKITILCSEPNKSIAEQFNLIRVCDPNRFPAFFEYLGREFNLEIKLRS